MKLIITLLTVLLVGCASTSKLPNYYPEQDTMQIEMHLYDSALDISARFPQGGFKRGLQFTDSNGICQIHVMAADHDAIAHEVAHCFYGHFHE